MELKLSKTINEYRPDIDGLRAVSVLAVMFFHFNISTLSGGYVGVDVFFVISGFLITKLIVSQVESGTFSFGNFYYRRARRLFPSFFFVCATTFVAATILFDPDNLQRTAEALIHALLGISNFHFWFEAGYFDTAADLKPYLHTWSLAVEEQFYLVWPLAVWLTIVRLGRYALIALLGAASIVSLIASEVWLGSDPQAVFFLMPFRIVEFGLGGACVFIRKMDDVVPSAALHALSLIGAALVAIGIFFFDEQTAFPGVISLVPCAGAAILIATGERSVVGRVISFAPIVQIGKMSYTIYLVHWPVFVFYKYLTVSEPDLFVIAGLALLVFMISAVIYALIETPLRYGKYFTGSMSKPGFGLVCSLLVLIVMIPALGASASQGWPNRFPRDVLPFIASPERERDNRLVTIEARKQFPVPGKPDALIIGDSHATDALNALVPNFREVNFRRAGISVICQPVLGARPHLTKKRADECQARMQRILNDQRFAVNKIDYIVFSARWRDWAVDLVPQTLRAIQEISDAKIYVMGPTIEFSPEVPELVARYGRLDGAEDYINKFQVDDRYKVNADLARVAEASGVHYIDKIALLCPNRRCPLAVPGTENTVPMYVDYGHWSFWGARYFGRHLRNEQDVFGISEGRSANPR